MNALNIRAGAEAEPRPDLEASSDAGWFDDNPTRRYRLRRGWAVRRVVGVYLRTRTDDTTTPNDGEADAEAVWRAAAWPGVDEKLRDDMMRKARKRAR